MTELALEIIIGREIKLSEERAKVSIFNSSKDNQPKLIEDTILKLLPPHRIRENKDGPAISPAIYISGSTRANKNVVDMAPLLFYDLDNLTKDQFVELNSKCSRLAVIWFTTHSFEGDPKKIKMRLVLVLSREMSPDEYRIVFSRVSFMLGGHDDDSCSDLARMYFLAAASEERSRHKRYVVQDGSVIDVDAILAMPSNLFPAKKKKAEKKEGRNSQLTSFAGKLRSNGAEFEDILSALKDENIKRFSTNPLSEVEVESIADSVSKYEITTPEKSKKAKDNKNLGFARLLIKKFKLVNISDRIYTYNGKNYVEINKGELNSLIVRTLDSFGVASLLAKKDFEETRFFIETLSMQEKEIAVGKPLTNPRDSADYINTQNGILKISRDQWNLELIPHSEDIFNVDCLPFEFDPNAKAETWLKFLNKVLPNAEVQKLLGEWIGLNLINETSFSRFMLFIGEGANGKSVVILIMQLLLGRDAFCSVGLDTMTPDNRFGLGPLIGMKANIVGDMNLTQKFSEGLFKEMVSGGIFTADRKHQTPTKVTATARHTFAMNDFPTIRDKSNGIFRRAMSTPFNVTIPPEEQDRRLITENFWISSGEIPGIFNWALEHLQNLIERGDFSIPYECQKVIDDLKETSRPEKEFLEDIIEIDSSSLIPCGELYFRYQSWAAENGYYQMPQSKFSREVQRTLKVEKTKNVLKCQGTDAYKERDRHWVGLSWKKHPTEDETFLKD